MQVFLATQLKAFHRRPEGALSEYPMWRTNATNKTNRTEASERRQGEKEVESPPKLRKNWEVLTKSEATMMRYTGDGITCSQTTIEIYSQLMPPDTFCAAERILKLFEAKFWLLPSVDVDQYQEMLAQEHRWRLPGISQTQLNLWDVKQMVHCCIEVLIAFLLGNCWSTSKLSRMIKTSGKLLIAHAPSLRLLV